MQNALDADIDRAASIVDGDMICVTVINHDEEKRLTVDPGQAVHDAIAEAFGCERQEQVQRVLFGDMDVLKGESFEQHGIEVAVTRCPALLPCLIVYSSSPLDLCMLRVFWPTARMGRGSVQASGRGKRVSPKWPPRLWCATLSLQLLVVSRSRG